MIRKKRPGLFADTDGVAVIEFAVTLPFLLLMFLGGAEMINYAIANMVVSRAGMTVADNAGRVMESIDESDVEEAFAAAASIAGDLDLKHHGRIVLSSLEENGRNGSREGQTINWQRCWGDLDVAPAYGVEGAGKYNADLADGMGPQGNKIAAATNTAIMYVEITYQYQPLLFSRVIPDRRIRFETAFNVRGRIDQDIKNTSYLTIHKCSSK